MTLLMLSSKRLKTTSKRTLAKHAQRMLAGRARLQPVVVLARIGMIRRAGACSRVGVSGEDDLQGVNQ